MRRLAVVCALAVLAAGLSSARVSAVSPPVYEHFIGALHEHSGYSDGFPGSRPEHYFASAKAHGLDFLMSGEHSDNARVPATFSESCLAPNIADCAIADRQQPENSVRKWEATLEQARAATDDAFTGVRGFEWSSDRFGHINVYFSEHDTNAKVDGGYASMEAFWEWFSRPAALGGGNDGLATFNHPGAKSLHGSDTALNWNNFEYRPEADQRMVGIEVYNDNDEFGRYYSQALDAGWHVGAIGAEDLGHRPRDGDGVVPGGGDPSDDWGGPKWPKTVLIATDKTEQGLREALLARRFYAVSDNSIRLDLTADGRPMGSRVTAPGATTVPITATVNRAAALELITNGGAIAATAQGTSLSFDAPVTSTESYYFLRVLDSTGRPQAYSSPIWIEPEDTGGGRWVAGDLHIHTTYSHDSYGGPSDDNTEPNEFYTLGHTPTSQFTVAASRGLGYLAITDHNDVRSQDHFGESGGVIPIGGYENSLNGHAQMLGAHRIYEVSNTNSAAAVNQMADELRADGGVFQINHPMEGTTDHGESPDWTYGFAVIPDTIEVWNISRLWQPPAPSSSSNDDAILWWQKWLDRGHKVAATGGSDNHYLATTPVQGAGQPTTWVYATSEGEAGILEGLRAGRTFISHQPPAYGGPRVFLEGDRDGDGDYESMVGDEIPSNSALRARVENAPGTFLRLIGTGGEIVAEVPVTSPTFEYPFHVDSDVTWVRAEIMQEDAQPQRKQACDVPFGNETTYCRNRLLVLAMTSALYLGEPDPDPTESPTPSDSPTSPSPDPSDEPPPRATRTLFTERSAESGQYSDDATLEVSLTTEDGTPIEGAELELGLAGSESRSFTAVTDETGVVSKRVPLDLKPGSYQLTARYAGSEDHDGSADTIVFVVDKEDTELHLVVTGNGSKRTLTATLADLDSGTGVAERAIEFWAEQTAICRDPSPATDAGGRATCSPPAPYQGGKRDFRAIFSSDDYYRGSQAVAR